MIDDCLDTVTRASRRVTDRVDVLVDETVTKTLAETRLVSSKIEATQTSLQSMSNSIGSIQKSQDKVQGIIISGEDKNTKGLDALASIIDRKIECATTRLTADLRILQTLLQTTLSDSPHRMPTQITPRCKPSKIRQATYANILHSKLLCSKPISDNSVFCRPVLYNRIARPVFPGC